MIDVLKAPPFATIQDLGRTGYLHAAVPRAGALDRVALAAANLLLGNSRDAAGIEWGLGGGEIRFERDADIALSGARATATLDGQPFYVGRAGHARAGKCLHVERIDAGAWLYLAVRGGVDVPQVLGSRATYLPAGFGGQGGRLLRTGDRLSIGNAPAKSAQLDEVPPGLLTIGIDDPIAIIPGPDRDLMSNAGWDWLVETEFRVSRAVSRMGYRLEAPVSGPALPGDRPSAPACVGTIQLPPGGQPIALMPDGPTVGGYPRAAVVASSDIGRLAQRRPGDPVRFRPIDVAEARARLRRQEELLRQLGGSA